MSKSLIIVESPAKAKTINRYLGKEYQVLASVGHIKDLPKKELGVNIDRSFEPQYQVMKSKSEIIRKIRHAAKSANKVYLASDPDREGEAIAAHLSEIIQDVYSGKIYRLLLYEITKHTILDSLKHPQELDFSKYNAQKARRVLDRLVGYQISPLLWERVRYRLSAGRVQSVALRLICEREEQIRKFQSEEYWKIQAQTLTSNDALLEIRLVKYLDKTIDIHSKDQDKVIIRSEEDVQFILDQVSQEQFAVSKVTPKQRFRKSSPPFITSTLQQDAINKLGFSSSRCMRIAQQLYEGVNENMGGLITYMRTDSVRVSDVAIKEVRALICQQFGDPFCSVIPNQYPQRGNQKIQNAHEAIRPTNVHQTPEQTKDVLNQEQQKLYELIWKRFVASQMAAAVFDLIQIDIQTGDYLWRANGSILTFAGFLKLYTSENREDENDKLLPPVKEGEILTVQKFEPSQHFTEPPPRYGSASLIKALEYLEIGRPSTFTAIMEVITKRDYVEMNHKRFQPTQTGMRVNDLLIENFSEFINVDFTADMERELDLIEASEASWVDVISQFYEKFSKNLTLAKSQMRNLKQESQPTDIPCKKCGQTMLLRWGKNGDFLSCSAYPECSFTAEVEFDEEGKPQLQEVQVSDEPCEKCGGDMVIKTGRFGKFAACNNYPKCKNTKPLNAQAPESVEGTCENCGAGLVKRQGSYGAFVACETYPACKYIKKEKAETGCTCPECSQERILQRRSRRGKIFYSCAGYPKCQFSIWNRPFKQQCPQCQFPILSIKETKTKQTVLCPNPDCQYEANPEEYENEISES